MNVVPGCGIDSQVGAVLRHGRTVRAAGRGRAVAVARVVARGRTAVGAGSRWTSSRSRRTSAARRCPWPRRDPVPSLPVLRHRRPPRPSLSPSMIGRRLRPRARARAPDHGGEVRSASRSWARRAGAHDTPVPTPLVVIKALTCGYGPARRLGRQSRTRRARTLRPWGDAPTVTPTSSTYKVVSRPHVVNSMGATTTGSPQAIPRIIHTARLGGGDGALPVLPQLRLPRDRLARHRGRHRDPPPSAVPAVQRAVHHGRDRDGERDQAQRGQRAVQGPGQGAGRGAQALQGRPVDEDDLALLAQGVEEAVRATGAAEVASHDVGLAVLDRCGRWTRWRTCATPRSTGHSRAWTTSRPRIALLRAEHDLAAPDPVAAELPADLFRTGPYSRRQVARRRRPVSARARPAPPGHCHDSGRGAPAATGPPAAT